MDYLHHYESPLGGITLSCDGKALTGLWFDGQKHFGESLNGIREEKNLPVFSEADRWLDLYFSGRNPAFTPELNPRATDFRKAVWRILLTVPYGETVTYGEIAVRLAKQRLLPRSSARAVGSAVAHNAIALIIPCHRVIGADGSMTGYAGGIERKRKLLEWEKSGKEETGPL